MSKQKKYYKLLIKAIIYQNIYNIFLKKNEKKKINKFYKYYMIMNYLKQFQKYFFNFKYSISISIVFQNKNNILKFKFLKQKSLFKFNAKPSKRQLQ